MSMTSKIRTLAGMAPADRAVARRAAIGLLYVPLMLRLVRIDRLQGLLRRRFPANPGDPSRLSRVAGIVSRVVAAHPYRANCLERSLVYWWLLGREGIGSDLRFGVRPSASGTPDFHAWIEVEGAVINDRPDIAEEFLPFEPVGGPPRGRLV